MGTTDWERDRLYHWGSRGAFEGVSVFSSLEGCLLQFYSLSDIPATCTLCWDSGRSFHVFGIGTESDFQVVRLGQNKFRRGGGCLDWP